VKKNVRWLAGEDGKKISTCSPDSSRRDSNGGGGMGVKPLGGKEKGGNKWKNREWERGGGKEEKP